MNFKDFTNSIAALLQRKTGDNCTVTVTNVLKNNNVRLTGVVITEENEGMSPTIYLEEPYRRYQEGASLQDIIEEIMALYEMHLRNRKLDMGFFRDFAQVEDRIFHKVINYAKNRELLTDVPYFRWHDLAVIFYYGMEEAAFGRASILIHNSHLDMWGKSAEEIYCVARRNMKRSMPELLLPMQKLMEELMVRRMSEEELTLYVLTNREKLFGASAMLYSEKIKELADRFGTDLLILPSSVHEVLILPDDRNREYDFYRRMVKEVNTTQVDPEEILSYSLYRYDRKKEEIVEISV